MKKLFKINKYVIFSITTFIVLSGITFFDAYLETSLATVNTAQELRFVKNEAFGYNERLEYKVGYKFITAGTGFFHIQPNPEYRNRRECYDVRFEVKSLSSLEFLYKVRDKYRTLLDAGGIFPWEFEQNVREGSYKKNAKAVFDQINNTATVKNKVYQVPDYVHDIVSAFYYVRTMDLQSYKNGSTFYLQNFYQDTTVSLGIRVLKRETIEVEAGKFRCIIIEPLVTAGGLFKNEGSIYIWLTDDDRKIPVKVATRILIGFVGADLTKYSGLRGPVDAKIN